MMDFIIRYINDNSFIIDRLILFTSICMFLVIFRNIRLHEVFNLTKSILLAMGAMIIIESVTVLPFILFLELDMSLVRDNIFILLILSLPTRIIESMAIILYYNRRKVSNEKNYKSN